MLLCDMVYNTDTLLASDLFNFLLLNIKGQGKPRETCICMLRTLLKGKGQTVYNTLYSFISTFLLEFKSLADLTNTSRVNYALI